MLFPKTSGRGISSSSTQPLTVDSSRRSRPSSPPVAGSAAASDLCAAPSRTSESIGTNGPDAIQVGARWICINLTAAEGHDHSCPRVTRPVQSEDLIQSLCLALAQSRATRPVSLAFTSVQLTSVVRVAILEE